MPNIDPLMEFGFTPAPNFYEAVSLVNQIGVQANDLNPVEAEEMGRQIVQLARIKLEDYELHPFVDTNRLEGNPGLAATITHKVDNGTLLITAGNDYAYYAKWVEYGSSHQKEPRPYLYPSIMEVMGMRETKQMIAGGIYTRAKIASKGARAGGVAGMIPMAASRRRSAFMNEGEGLAGLLAIGAVAVTVASAFYSGGY
jgi:hypothetical protein